MKWDGKQGTAGKGALIQIEKSATLLQAKTNTCFSQLTIIQDVTGAMENQLGWGIKQSETMYTINGTQISGVAYLIARVDNAEIL